MDPGGQPVKLRHITLPLHEASYHGSWQLCMIQHMTVIQALFLSVIEGITEFLPISSTGHLILTVEILGIAQTDFVKNFEIIIQLGAILAVVVLHWRILLEKTVIWKPIFTAFFPTAVIGFVFYKAVKHFLIGNVTITIFALLFGGIILITLEKIYKNRGNGTIEQLRVVPAFLIGLAQSLSIVPGISRSAATIIGGLLVGLSRKEAVFFSFLLAIPTMFAATSLDLVESSFQFSGSQWILLTIGFIGAFSSALIVVRAFLRYVQRHTIAPFGVYRIALSIVFWMFMRTP